MAYGVPHYPTLAHSNPQYPTVSAFRLIEGRGWQCANSPTPPSGHYQAVLACGPAACTDMWNVPERCSLRCEVGVGFSSALPHLRHFLARRVCQVSPVSSMVICANL